MIDARTPVDAKEAFAVLLSSAHRRTLRIPADLLVRHVLALHVESDWPVQRAALEAVLRRAASAKRENLQVERRPARAELCGAYVTRRRNGAARPYRTQLRSLDPLSASCGCPDFVVNSLGLCKHVLCALDDLASNPTRFERARRALPSSATAAFLRWDPVQPLSGAADWLARVELRPGASAASRRVADHAAFALLVRSRDGALRPKPEVLANPEKRERLVEALLQISERVASAEPIEPALAALLRAEQRRLAERLALRKVDGAALRGLRRKLYAYQKEGIERFLASGRLLLADDMGLGKTVQAVAAAHALFHAGRVRRGLFIVPASLKSQWKREWNATSDVPVEIVEGPPELRRRTYRRTTSGFLIANYEQLWRDFDVVSAWRPGLVVLDEAQRIKNWATKTAETVKRLTPAYRLVLTGTPMENRLPELASILEWVDERALEPKWRLTPWHSLTADGRPEVVGARNLDTLRERIAPSFLRRLRREVLSQLPPRTDTVVPVELCEAQRGEHDALLQPIARLASIAKRRPLTQQEFLKLMTLLTTQRIIANGIAQYRFPEIWPGISAIAEPDDALLESLGSPKLAELRPIVANLVVEQGRKIVIFSQWRRMLRLAAWCIDPILRTAGLRSAFFTGEESLARRTHNLVDLHDDPRTSVLFATDAGGVGVNLQRAASAVVNLDLPWNPAVLEQRIGRIHRIGQKRPIDVFHLVSQGSIEERISTLVSDKKAIFSGLFDGSSDQVTFERSGGFLAGVERLIEETKPPIAAEASATASDEDAEEREELTDRTADSIDTPATEAPAHASSVPVRSEIDARGVDALFASLEIETLPSGRIRIEAPRETAATLSALLRGLAGLLERA